MFFVISVEDFMENKLFTVWIFFWYKMHNIATASYMLYANISIAFYNFYEMNDMYEMPTDSYGYHFFYWWQPYTKYAHEVS